MHYEITHLNVTLVEIAGTYLWPRTRHVAKVTCTDVVVEMVDRGLECTFYSAPPQCG